jgi:citrate lyase subunit beta/citryl-CoA lyase
MTTPEPRSWLFVPADSDRKLAKALTVGADALILDLEDSVVPDARPRARLLAVDYLRQWDHAKGQCWVRCNPINTEAAVEDLMAVLPGRPTGIVLPKALGMADIGRLGRQLDELERENGIELGHTKIVSVASETPAAVLKLAEFAEPVDRRLFGLTWGAEDLATELGATNNREGADFTEPYRVVRSLVLVAARAAGVQPIDTLYSDFKDPEGLALALARARRDGFLGMLAIHPGQVEAINAAFTPSEAEIQWASKVIAAFETSPGAGVLSLEGKMIDRPHLLQARQLIQRSNPPASAT